MTSSQKRINVSHSVLGGEWSSIEAEVLRQLPLKNLHWKSKSANRPGISTIQSLLVNFRPLASSDLTANSVPLLERPYLHLLFVICDDNEVYRATVRTQIREWLDGIIARPNQEWLIVNLTSGKNAGAKFYQRKGSVVDKIKADFNAGKKDRCVHVAQGGSAEDPTTWAEFLIKMKEGVIVTFDTNVSVYEEDVRKADSQRQLEGWQYTSFFLQKEGLADCFETMNLLEEALIQYDELEASFFQTLKENKAAWLGKIGGLASGDDALPVLSTSNKPYRQLILSNTITVFDFRIYLFARQASILFELGRMAEAARRSAFFISQFTRTLRENQDTLGPNFLESWTYSACLNVVDECTRRAADKVINSAALDSFGAVKGELLDLARKQLDKLGIGAGHLPLAHPFSMSMNEFVPDRAAGNKAHSTPESSDGAVTRQDLLEAIAHRDKFDKLYIDLSNRTIQAYQASHRKRSSLKLHAALAALEDHRGRFPSAQKLYAQLPAHYVDHRWVKIESTLLAQCTRLQGELGMPKERLLSTLALVRAGVEYTSKIWTLEIDYEASVALEPKERMAELASKLMDDVYDLSKMLTKDFAAVAFPTFSMSLASNRGAAAVGEDGMTVKLLIKSLLPCPLKIDEVRLKFSTPEGEQIWFTSGACTVTPGITPVTLFCPTSMSGQLSLELSQIRFSRIIFQYSHRPVSSRNLAPDLRTLPQGGSHQQPVIYFPRDLQAVNVYTEPPRAIHLDQSRNVVLCVATGRNQLVKVTIKVTVANVDVTLDMPQASIMQGNARLGASTETDTLLVEDVEAASIIKIQIPIIGHLADPSIELSMAVEYFTSKRPGTRRALRRTAKYPVSLPLAVNVQDYFRRDCLLSKFAVTTDGVRTLKIKSAVLEGVTGIEVKSCRSSTASTITLLPLQSANFLFKILASPNSEPKELVVKVTSAVASVVSASALAGDLQWFTEAVVANAEKLTNMLAYSRDGTLTHLTFYRALWTERVQHQFAASVNEDALTLLQDIYEILNHVRMTPSCTRTEVGQPLPVSVSVRPAFNWTNPPLEAPILLSYEINGTFDDWLVSGRKRGEFVAEAGKETVIPLTLIPLRPGSLFLPSMSIRPALPSDTTTCETQHANAGTTIEVLPIISRTAYTIEFQDHHTSYVHPV
ncbi:hypothetical protein RQP46_003839 [Phenoliferia psychrophenolica]